MIISIAGGLGNQMFQYAYYVSQKMRYPQEKVLADLSFYDIIGAHNGYELSRVFGIQLDLCDESLTAAHRVTNTFLDKLRRRFGAYYAGFHYTLRDKGRGFDKRFLENFKEDDYLYGFWQCERYFADYREKIRKDFTFPDYAAEENRQLSSEMASCQSIGIHVRRGDYLGNKLFVNLGESGYYTRAVERIKAAVPEHRAWYIFSDDIDWCRENLDLQGEKVTYVSGNTGKESFRDMQLMTQCRHLIIANSSFSWWGAYLNRNQGTILAPWEFNVDNPNFNRDICPDCWERI